MLRAVGLGRGSWVLGLGSAVLLAFSYPIFNLEFLAWFAFVPFFFALANKSKFSAFKTGFLFGLIFFAVTVYWIAYVSFLGFIILILYLALYFGLFGFLIQPTTHNPQPTTIFFIPLIWVLLEYTRTYLFSGLGWALLGYSQYLNIPLIQIADQTGVWGVSFIIMMVNVAIFKLLKEGIGRTISIALIVITVLGVSVLYGHIRLGESPPSRGVVISIIQGNIPQHQKWDERYEKDILTRYETLTKDAAADGPDLIIWPETALPGYLEEDDLRKRIARLTRETKVPLLIGAPSVGGHGENIFHNSAILISKEGQTVDRYDKLHLVPFGEYVPFEEKIGFVRRLINKPIGDFSAGAEYTIFKLKSGARFGVLICFEDIFPRLVRRFVKKGADFMVNITNDAWFMESSAPYQHAQSSVFRAVENRVPVIRAANTGLSCFIDSRGRIIDRVRVGGKDIFIAGFKTSKIHIR